MRIPPSRQSLEPIPQHVRLHRAAKPRQHIFETIALEVTLLS